MHVNDLGSFYAEEWDCHGGSNEIKFFYSEVSFPAVCSNNKCHDNTMNLRANPKKKGALEHTGVYEEIK
jgi:hypothetical protein